jgi:hypothetical protein
MCLDHAGRVVDRSRWPGLNGPAGRLGGYRPGRAPHRDNQRLGLRSSTQNLAGQPEPSRRRRPVTGVHRIAILIALLPSVQKRRDGHRRAVGHLSSLTRWPHRVRAYEGQPKTCWPSPSCSAKRSQGVAPARSRLRTAGAVQAPNQGRTLRGAVIRRGRNSLLPLMRNRQRLAFISHLKDQDASPFGRAGVAADHWLIGRFINDLTRRGSERLSALFNLYGALQHIYEQVARVGVRRDLPPGRHLNKHYIGFLSF